jgi:hypothetical protein
LDKVILQYRKVYKGVMLSDYFYKKKLDYSLTSVLKFREDWLEEKTIEEIKQILKEQYER